MNNTIINNLSPIYKSDDKEAPPLFISSQRSGSNWVKYCVETITNNVSGGINKCIVPLKNASGLYAKSHSLI